MAVTHSQRLLGGGHHTSLATPLSRCSSAILRRTACQRCGALATYECTLLTVLEDQPPASKHQAPPPLIQQRRACTDSVNPTPSELVAALRDSTSSGQIFHLYQLWGPIFTHTHAHVALNRLVDVTALPASERTDPSPNDSPAQDPVEPPTLSRPTPQQTGRLLMQEVQKVVTPPLQPPLAVAAAAPPLPHDGSAGDAIRRGSNSEASTSDKSLPNPPERKWRRTRRGISPKRGRRRSRQPKKSQTLNTAGDVTAQPASAVESPVMPPDQPQLQQPQPPRPLVVSMVSGLVAILSHHCSRLNGLEVAETARALSRLRYHDASLLHKLEQRSIGLMEAFREEKMAAATAAVASMVGFKVKEHSRGRRSGSTSIPSMSGGKGVSSTCAEPGAEASTDRNRTAYGSWDHSQHKQQHQGGHQKGDMESCMSADDLYTMIAAFGALGHRPSRAWCAAIVAATEHHLPRYAASKRGRLAIVLSSLGAFGARPPPRWLRATCDAMEPRLMACPPPQLRALAAGLASLRHHPGQAWMTKYLEASERRLGDYSTWELVSTMSSLSSLQCTPAQGWMERFYGCVAAFVGRAGGMTGPLASVLLSSLAQLQCKPESEWLALLLLGTRRSLADATAEELTDVLAALARLRFRPPEPWLQQYFAASFQRLPFQTVEQCCTTAVSMSTLTGKQRLLLPMLWLEELGRHTRSKLALMPAGQQSSCVMALVELGFVPSSEWLESYEKQSNGKLAESSPEELCRVLGALAKVGFKPQVSWLYAFILAVYSKLDTFDSIQLVQIFDCLPVLASHGSCLDEIIQICAAESTMRYAQLQTQAETLLIHQAEYARASRLEQRRRQRQHAMAAKVQLAVVGTQPSPAGKGGQEVGVAGVEVTVSAARTTAAARIDVETGNRTAAAAGSSGSSRIDEPARPSIVAAAAVRNAASHEGSAINSAEGNRRNGNVAAVAAASDGSELLSRQVRPANMSKATDYPAALTGATIAISRELLPAVGTVLPMGAPCSAFLNGAAPAIALGGLAVGVGMVRGRKLMEVEEDWPPGSDEAMGASDDGYPGDRLRVPQEKTVLLDASVTVAAAADAATATPGIPSEQEAIRGNNSADGASHVVHRRRRRGDDPGSSGGSDGGAPGGRRGSWEDELSANAATPGLGDGRDTGDGPTTDVGSGQRPQATRPSSAAVLVAASSAAPLSLPENSLLPSDAHLKAQEMGSAVVEGKSTVQSPEESQLASNLGLEVKSTAQGLPAAVSTLFPAVMTLHPKPRPPVNTASLGNATAGVATGAPAVAAGTDMAAPTALSPAGAAPAAAAEASKLLLPFGSVAKLAQEEDTVVQTVAAEAEAPLRITADGGKDGRVQFLDSASLSRLMSASDAPPSPNFSTCQGRAKQVDTAGDRGSGPGPFRLGRIWTNDASGVNGSDGGSNEGVPMSGPIPSPSG